MLESLENQDAEKYYRMPNKELYTKWKYECWETQSWQNQSK